MEPKVTIKVRRVAEGIAALEILGEMTRLAEKPLDAAVAEAVALGARGVILDFYGLTYMNNKGASLLVRLEARSARPGPAAGCRGAERSLPPRLPDDGTR